MHIRDSGDIQPSLLTEPAREHAEHETPKTNSPNHLSRKRSNLAVPALLLVLLMTLLSVKLMSLPLDRILELRYCLEYYQVHDPTKIPSDGDIPESDCKIEYVQQRLGWTMGAFDTTMQACDLAIATPLGYLADKIGRRLILALNCISTAVLLLWITSVGSIRSIPPTVILVGPFLTLFGGGNNVFKSVSVALMSDLAETDSQRTSNISYFLSADYVSMLAGPMLAAFLMPHGLMLPLWTGVVVIAVSTPLLDFVPKSDAGFEANTHRTSDSNDHERQTLLNNAEAATVVADVMAPSPRSARSPIHDFLTEYINLLKASPSFRLLLLSKFLASFASSSSSLLALYITLRTGWTFAEVGYIYTFKGTINILLAAVIVPFCARHFTSKDSTRPASSFTFNLIATRLALLVSIMGAVFVALARTKSTIIAGKPSLSPVSSTLSPTDQYLKALCVYALGSVLPIFMYAIARSSELGVLNERNEGSGFTVLVVVQALGALVGAPTMAAVWVKAIEVGGYGLGLPYFVSAGAYVAALGVMLFFGVGDRVDGRRLD